MRKEKEEEEEEGGGGEERYGDVVYLSGSGIVFDDGCSWRSSLHLEKRLSRAVGSLIISHPFSTSLICVCVCGNRVNVMRESVQLYLWKNNSYRQ